MAQREVELLIKARDQASSIARSITESFDKLAQSSQQVGEKGNASAGLLGRLQQQLASLQATATGLGQFQKVAVDLERADSAVIKLTTDLARSQDAFERNAANAGSAATAFAQIQEKARGAQAELNGTNLAIQKQSAEYRKLTAALESSTAPNQALRESVRQQQQSLISLVEQQSRQQAIVRDLNVQVAQHARTVTTANTALERSRTATVDQNDALEQARIRFGELKTNADQAGTALGGVAADQAAVVTASQRTASAIQQVSAAIAQQRAALAGGTNTVSLQGPSAEATAAFRAQIAAVEQTKTAWAAAQSTAQRLGVEIRNVKNPTAALTAEFELAKLAAGEAKRAFLSQDAALRQTRQGLQFVQTAFQPLTASARAAAAAQSQAGAASNTLSGKLQLLINRLLGTKRAADSANASIAKISANSNRSFLAKAFGVEDNRVPSRLQNLSFQINDIISGLVSGQRPAQIFAQQAGQIGQLFPAFNNLLLTFVRMLPIIALIGVALSPAIAAFVRLGRQADSLREFNQLLAGTGAQSSATAHQLADVAQRLDEFGGTTKDAVAAEREFLSAGIAIEHFEALGRAAQHLSGLLGTDMPQAAQRFAQAITGSATNALELDRQINFLNDSERARILAIAADRDATHELTNAQEQARIVATALERKNNAIAGQQRGGWSEALRQFRSEWDSLNHTLANTGIIDGLARAFDNLGRASANSIHAQRLQLALGQHDGNVAAANRQLQEEDRRASGQTARVAAGATSPEEIRRLQQAQTARDNEFARAQALQLSQQTRIANATREGRESQAAMTAQVNLENAARAAGAHLTQQQIDDERARAILQERNRQAQAGANRDQQSLVTRQRTYNAALVATNAERAAEIDRLGHTRREQAVMLALAEAETRAVQQRVALSDAQRQSIRESATALFDAQSAEQLRVGILQDQISLRERLHQQSSDEQRFQEQIIIRQIDLTTELGQAQAALVRQNIQADDLQNQVERVNSLAGLLREGQREFRAAETAGETQAQLQTRIDQLTQIQQRIIAARDAAIQLAQRLGDQQTIDQLNAINVTLDTTRAQLLTVADANKLVADGLTSAVLASAEAIGQAVDGTISWRDALGSVGDAFLKFAADFLLKISEMIIQAQILKALQNSPIGGLISSVTNSLGGAGMSAAIIAAGTTASAAITVAGTGVAAAITAAGVAAAAAIAAASAANAAASVAKFLHTGGIVGQGGVSKRINPAVFAGAARFHSGGFPGLKSNEVPAILQKGEEVVTRQDKRNRLNGGGGNLAQRVGVTINNLIDSGEFLSKGLGTSAGEKAIMNFVRDRRSAFKAALG